jgi:hypothetical protein
MASGPEHYQETERQVNRYRELGYGEGLQLAQIHATLALAAATAYNRGAHGTPTTGWQEVTQPTNVTST